MSNPTAICPISPDPCPDRYVCDARRLCRHVRVAPIDLIMADVPPALHFVGFKTDDERHRAQRIFGPPDFLHRVWDHRAFNDIAVGYDRVIFARYANQPPTPYSHDDSAQPDDPATRERCR